MKCTLIYFNLLVYSLVNSNPKFGKHLLDLFFLEKDYININHGSYGSPARSVVAKHRAYQEECDSNTEKWYRYKIYEKLNTTRKTIANYVNAEVDDVVLVENASDGVNSIFKSIKFNPGDKVLIFDCAYGMVISTLNYMVDMYQIQFIKLVLDKETINSDQKILIRLEEILEKEGPIKFASIDHIPSVPHVVIPVKEITRILKKHNVIVFVDGAHTVGSIPLDIKDLNPDFYISNFHKWAYAPKSATFLYVSKEFQNMVHPNIISFQYKKGYTNEYSYTGTRDYSAYFSIPDALEFRKAFGEKDIFQYMNDLAWEAGKEVVRIWGTEMLILEKNRIGSLVNVRIPCNDEQILNKANYKALYEHNVYVVVFKYNDGNFYTRLSAQIYNELSDYVYAAETFLKIINDLKSQVE